MGLGDFLGGLAASVPGAPLPNANMTNVMTATQSQNVTANPMTNVTFSTGGGALSDPKALPGIATLAGAALLALIGWKILG